VAVGELPGRVKANGKEFHLNIAHVWTVKHGLATRMEAYIDTPTMLAALEG
jgi:ketosteroid isomerase-like protein